MLFQNNVVRWCKGLVNTIYQQSHTLSKIWDSRIRSISTVKNNVLFNKAQTGCRLDCQDESCLVLGVYVSDKDTAAEHFTLTETAEKFDFMIGHRLSNLLDVALPAPRLGEGKVFYGLHNRFVAIAVVGLGDPCLGYNESEQIDERKEAIRTAVGVGVRLCQDVKYPKIFVESFNHAESAAEGASMGSWLYQDLKTVSKRRLIKKVELFDSCDYTGWKIGLHKAAAQNFTRLLSESPGNNLTPCTFAQTAIETLSKYGISVNVRMQNWAKLRNLHGFLHANRGTCEPPVLLEMLYEGCNPDVEPVVMVGKGTTFDAGGLCLKPYNELQHGRGDIFGAAALVATFRAIASLELPLNVVGLIPLCVNTIGSSALKPGDVVKTYNDKTIFVGDTDSEGLLMYADVLSYAQEYCPKFILDVGTLTPDLVGAFSTNACGVWSNNDSLYEMLRIASIHTGDRIFRYPLWDSYAENMKNVNVADFTNNTPRNIGGGASKAAAFLREFVPQNTDWVHIDTYNTNVTDGNEFSYLRKGMSGRYTRIMIEFLAQLSWQDSKKC